MGSLLAKRREPSGDRHDNVHNAHCLERGDDTMMRLKSHSAQAYMDAISRMGGLVDDHAQWRRAELPRQMGKGTWEFYQLQKGIELTISRYQFDQAVRVDFVHDRPMFCFGCLLEGDFELRDRSARGFTALSRGQGMNMWTSEGRYSFLLSAKQYVGVQLIVEPEVLLEKFGEADMLPPELRKAVTQSSFPVQIKTNCLSPSAYSTSMRALSILPDDPLRLLQFESFGLAILREQLLSTWPPKSATHTSLSRQDSDRVYAVRDMLFRHPEDSPSLQELAHRVGMNEFSMTRGFRLQFGQSIYAFLRRRRMEIADQLLAEGEYNVGEIAHAVGYRSLGRFAAAFERQFGVTPKRHQLALRSRQGMHPNGSEGD